MLTDKCVDAAEPPEMEFVVRTSLVETLFRFIFYAVIFILFSPVLLLISGFAFLVAYSFGVPLSSSAMQSTAANEGSATDSTPDLYP